MLARFMLILACAAALACLAPVVSANAVSPYITYQGKLTDANGVSVPDVAHTLVFRIYGSEIAGLPLWTSPPMIVTPAGGLFTVELGPITPNDLPPGDAWIEVSVNGTNLPRTKLTSAPYALRAADLRLPFARTHPHTEELISLVNPTGGILRASSGGNRDTATFIYDDTTGFNSALSATSYSNTGATAYITQMGRGPVAVFDSFNNSAVNPTVSMYTSSSQPGLYAYSFLRASAVYLTEPLAALRAVQGTATNAGHFEGSVRTTGTLRVDDGRVENKDSERLTPIAYGHISANGNAVTGTSTANVSSLWNSSQTRYEITISGHSYFFSSYVTTVTPSGAISAVIPTTSSTVGGNLLVYLYNLSGNRIQGDFQFVTYKK